MPSRIAGNLVSGLTRRLALGLVPLLLIACGGDSTAPHAVPAPTFNFMNGPATAGTYVVRVADFDYATLYIYPFDETPDGDWWVVFVGLPDPPTDWCDGVRDPIPTSVQSIEQDSRTHVLRLRVSEPSYAWHWLEFANEWDAGGLCNALALPRVAAGTASEQSTDNDLFGQTSHDAWGWMMNGELAFQGRTYNMQAIERAQFSDTQGFRIVAQQYRIW